MIKNCYSNVFDSVIERVNYWVIEVILPTVEEKIRKALQIDIDHLEAVEDNLKLTYSEIAGKIDEAVHTIDPFVG